MMAQDKFRKKSNRRVDDSEAYEKFRRKKRDQQRKQKRRDKTKDYFESESDGTSDR